MKRDEIHAILREAPALDGRQAYLAERFGAMFGWITAPDQAFLCGFLPAIGLAARAPLRIVEVGTFGGSTARGLITLTGGGEIICIDDFYDFRHHEGKPRRNPMLNHFESGAAMFAATLKGPPDLSAYATLLEAPSTSHPSCRCCPPIAKPASEGWTQPIDLLFVDGDHSYEGALSDLRAFAPHVVPGGYCLVDDTHMPDVLRACREYFGAGWEPVRLPDGNPASIAVYHRRRAA